MTMLKTTTIHVLMMILLPICTFAQYGNEWIDHSQNYYQIKVGANGIYRIDYNALNHAGLPLSSINPRYFQLIRNGEETDIYIAGENDNSFDPEDFIEFYGEYNDGSLDTKLYINPQDQHHKHISLYTDTSLYYLTWTTNTPGKRISSFFDGNYSGKTADTWIWYKSLQTFRNELYDGDPYITAGFFSEYSRGEGFFSQPIVRHLTPILSVNTPFYNPSGPAPVFEAVIYGKSDPTNPGDIINGLNHEVQIQVNSQLIFSKKFRGYTRVFASDTLQSSMVGTTTNFRFVSSYLSQGRQAVSYISVKYPRLPDLNNTAGFNWEYQGNNEYFEFSNYKNGLSDPVIYDLSHKQRITGQVNAGLLQFNTSNSANKHLVITDETEIPRINAANIKAVNFIDHDFSATNYNFIIITHPSLSASAEEYKNYRESSVGGNHRVFIAYSTQLYLDFYYGMHHPLAIKNFCRYIYETQAVSPEFLLLLGKGQSYNRIVNNTVIREYEDLIPTWGIPPSDYFFVTDYGDTANLKPLMGIGRIPARSDQEVLNYLEKVKLHESQANTSKTVLQLSGGFTASESNILLNHQNALYNTAKGLKFGADRILITKENNESSSSTITESIQESINDGVQMLSYFGHGAAQILEIDIGPVSTLNNKAKYPLFLFMGCALGNTYQEISLPESFLLEKDNGAIAWIASSSFGFINELRNWSSVFYHKFFNEYYGYSIGRVIQETVGEYQKPYNLFNRSQCRQMTYHGDPSLKFYAPDKPDYSIGTNISLYPEDVNAESDSFALDFEIFNLGRGSDDTAWVHINIRQDNDSIRQFGPIPYPGIYNRKTIRYWIPTSQHSAGINKVSFTVDPNNTVSELDPDGEFNNSTSFEFFMPSNSLFPVDPPKDAIISHPEVILQVQNYNLLAAEDEFIFEIDSSPLFNSPLFQSSGVINGSNIISHRFVLAPLDSTDYYWRARFNKPEDEGGSWKKSSFAFIYNSPEGWSQGHYEKLKESNATYIKVDTTTHSLQFDRIVGPRLEVLASGYNGVVGSRGIFINAASYYAHHISDRLAVVAVNPDNLDRFSDNSQYNQIVKPNSWGMAGKYYEVGERSGGYWFDMRDSSQRDSFIDFMHRIPENYILLLFTSRNTGNAQWEEDVYQAFEEYGAFTIRNVLDGEPYGLIAQRNKPHDAIEITANYNSVIDPRDQSNAFAMVSYPLANYGELYSPKVGPAKRWAEFYRTVRPFDSDQDQLWYNIYGVKKDGSTDLLISDIDSNSKMLSHIDAEIYPFLQIKGMYSDPLMLTPADQQRWTLLYDPAPEGSIQPSLSYLLSHDTIQEGDSMHIRVAFQNISKWPMDSVLVLSTITNSLGQRDTLDYKKYDAINSGENFIIRYDYPVFSQSGDQRLIISINHEMEQLEQSLSNNVLSIRYHVINDRKNPLLDVVFDGSHILNYDILSPNPKISVSAIDENEFMYITDPASFHVTLTDPDGQTLILNTSDPNVQFKPAHNPGDKAVLEYQANNLPSGIYQLRAKVSDASGNTSGEMEYEIHFEVIREASISNLYPYPNPFTTNMKFIYTLTGETIPDYMKIQIMTVSGRVVREITQQELGMIKIGNNISEFSWDGTDEFGDRLANGVYLYKVTAKLNGEDIKLRETSGDQFFKNGFGKIYLMR